MASENPNVTILQDVYSEWHKTKGDPSVVLEILADEIRWGSAADGKLGMDFAKKRASKEEVAGYFHELVNEWSMEFFHVNEMVAQGGRVVVLCECSWTNKRTGKRITLPKVDVWYLENGIAIEFMEYFDTHAAVEAATA